MVAVGRKRAAALAALLALVAAATWSADLPFFTFLRTAPTNELREEITEGTWSSTPIVASLLPFNLALRSNATTDTPPLRPRFLVFPLTHYGPNVQLTGLLQTLAFCAHVGVQCVEPGFSDLFCKHTFPFPQLFDTGTLNIAARSSLPTPLRPDLFVFTTKWPTRVYFRMHGVNNPRQSAFGRTVRVNPSFPSCVHKIVALLRSELEQFHASRPTKDFVVALVYGDSWGKPVPPSPLASHFLRISHALKPVQSLRDEAERVRGELFGSESFLALHLRLRDRCRSSIDECCCTTSGSFNSLTRTDIEGYIEWFQSVSAVRNVFISGPPALANMTLSWPWAQQRQATVKLWYSDTRPGSIHESMVQQLLCSKAVAFAVSVRRSTWSDIASRWMSPTAPVLVIQRGVNVRHPPRQAPVLSAFKATSPSSLSGSGDRHEDINRTLAVVPAPSRHLFLPAFESAPRLRY